ncbi:MAG: 4-(cytidine 5'-diphospho)-2-C-methyl-D-erythritol kinase [Oscillibacter sp.]|jgi:4-diphosphocytidyl-2-C-methyl-D-erythritol kinase|nr:4-(cytidine 5'-diphospho)-2-C-methyl-D-erythritol kinase [Oscillibacter sp.]
MRELTKKAPAKLNLTLDILRRREDGYHEMKMVMQTISLCDTVSVWVDTGSGKTIVRTDNAALPDGPENIAYKAAAAFYAATGMENTGTEILVEKHIPFCAGMAGGSADGAAVLHALRELTGIALPDRRLEEIGGTFGSDVPFCVRGGTALAEGRGEVLTTLPSMPACWIAVCKPDFDLPTPALFHRVQVDKICRRPDTEKMTVALSNGNLSAVAAELGDVFEEFLLPEERIKIDGIKKTMLNCGALNAAMTGSGPTVFGLFDRESKAQQAVEVLRAVYSQTFLAQPI